MGMELMRNRRHLRHRRHLSTTRAAGFSLVEVLIAMVILLIIAVGIMPIFTQASVSNVSGNDSTRVSNFARDRAEEVAQYPFNSTEMTITAGSEAQLPPGGEFFSTRDQVWKPGAPTAGDPGMFTRTTVIRQYSVEALEDGVLDIGEALPAGSALGDIQLKEIQVSIEGTRALGSTLGPAKRLSVRLLKAS